MKNRLKLFIPLFIFVALAVLFWQGLKIDPNKMPSALVGKTVPEFALPTVANPDQVQTQAAMKGKGYALINVWATWCGPCRQEHPFLVELAEQGIPIFGINAQDDLTAAQRWLVERGDPYVFSVFDQEGRLGLDLGVYGYPETFLIDNEGTVLHRRASVINKQVWQEEFLPLMTGDQ